MGRIGDAAIEADESEHIIRKAGNDLLICKLKLSQLFDKMAAS